MVNSIVPCTSLTTSGSRCPALLPRNHTSRAALAPAGDNQPASSAGPIRAAIRSGIDRRSRSKRSWIAFSSAESSPELAGFAKAALSVRQCPWCRKLSRARVGK